MKYDNYSLLYRYIYDFETLEKITIIDWKNSNHLLFLYSNFYFYNYDINNLYLHSSFIKKENHFLINVLKKKNFNIENEDFSLLQISENFFFDENIFENYLFVRQSSFINFFIGNFIDVPICFWKSKSLQTKNFELFFLKFSNLFMWDGTREKSFRLILKSFFQFFNDLKQKTFIANSSVFTWFELFYYTNTLVKLNSLPFWVNNNLANKFEMVYNHTFSDFSKEYDYEWFIKNFISSKFLQFSPMFTYYIYNVDKNIRKYTRGKSGKYVFIWKYIAPYKRKYVMYRWFLKEINFDENRILRDRIINLMQKLTFNIKSTYAWKAKNYTYAFVFKNFKKSLLNSLKTTAK